MNDLESTKRIALLVMDIRENILTRLSDPGPLIGSIQRALNASRNAGILVIYVVVGFRPGFPEISPDNKSFSSIKKMHMLF